MHNATTRSLRGLLFIAGLGLGTAGTARAQGPDISKFITNKRHYVFAQRDAESPAVQNVTKNTDEEADVNGTYTRLAYRPYAQMLTEIDELRRLHTWADTTYQRRLAALPPGGALQVTIRRKGPGSANLSNLVIVATDKAGQEVFKIVPPATPGRFFGRDLYQAQGLLPLPKVELQELKVRVGDAKLYLAFEYLVTVPPVQ
ncbi:hypothetical protein [Hymenobacter coccineus]|uniref:Uncharacterized protein n=1 Tax=Hymenobacter coccineus TaxID=1908235 RepID=A0A1G1THG9_9BACT|nr:hypothetical protein [Hymenobacter coccineus]OGX90263.1 hypothetical protein BEN49_23365 [Hymenobacter coccineus]